MFSKEQSMLLDMWNEKHIQILKKRFNDCISKKQTNNSLDYTSFLNVFDHTNKKGFEKGSSILQIFGSTICKDFCCALSIICLGSSNEKLRFLFDLFDLDRDGFLSRKELLVLLNQLINVWIPPQNAKAKAGLRSSWIEIQIQGIYSITGDMQNNLDFQTFKFWAENSIDIYKVLSVFELVPNPWKEHEIILQILDSYQRKHGDTMYALSYRWWDQWKEYTEKHPSTLEVQQFVGKVRESIAQHNQLTNEHKNLFLGLDDIEEDGVVFDKKIASNITGTLEKTQWASNNIIQSIKIENNEDLGLSFSMRQQIALQQRRTSAIQNTKLIATPRQSIKSKFSQSNMNLKEDSNVDEVESKYRTNPEKTNLSPTRSVEIQQTTMTNFQKHIHDNIKDDLKNQLNKNTNRQIKSIMKSLTAPQSINQTRNSYYQNEQLEDEPIESVSEGEDVLLQDQDVIQQLKDSAAGVNSAVEESTKINKLNSKKKLNQLVSQSIMTSAGNLQANRIEIQKFASVTSLIKIEESKIPGLISNFGKRPLAIDNSDIEGDYPGQLQLNLIMYRDFVTIPEAAWNLFCFWYGQSERSPVFARKVLMHNSIASMELYPPRILCVISDRDGKPIADSQKSLFVSTSLTISEVHLKICELFNYISTRDTRLWVKGAQVERDNDWTLVQTNSHTLKDGDIFMVEVKFYGNQWPMDEKVGRSRLWQQFEIGDKLDVKDGEIWKIGCIDKVNKDTLKIHLINETWKNDLTIRKDSELLAQFGQHTLSLHFKNNDSNSQALTTQVQGIKNIGNTCYMNACLQALLHTPLYNSYFTTPAFKFFLQQKREETVFISEAFCSLIQQIQQQQQTSNITVLDPNYFKKIVNTCLPLFFGNQQEDAAEFFNFMLDKMNEEMNRADKVQVINSPSPILPKPIQQSTDGAVIIQSIGSENNKILKVSETGEIGGTYEETNKQNVNVQPQNSATSPDNSTLIVQTLVNTQSNSVLKVAQRSAESIVEERKLKEDEDQRKILIQKKAISEAKQTVYNEFFQKSLVQERSSRKFSNQSFTEDSLNKVMPDSFNPNISELEAKARSAWFSALNQTNSPISDLFVGQQTTELTCLKCNNKSHTFENFYSLPIPLPANLKTVFYFHIVRWQKRRQRLTPIVAYGIQLNKYNKLQTLIDEIKKLVNLNSSQFIVCEIGMSRIFRIHEDTSTPLSFIAKRTNQLYFFEQYPEQIPIRNQLPQIQITKQKSSLIGQSFNSFEEIQPGMLIDAKDQYNKWYVALIVDKEIATQNQLTRICVHFYQLNQRFDEWFEESMENLRRLRPHGASGQAEQPKDSMVKMIMMHRRTNNKLIQSESQNYIGLPYCIAIPNWLTWKGLNSEISVQIYRHIKLQESGSLTDCQEENVLNETDTSTLIQPSQLENLNRGIRVTTAQSPNILNFKQIHASGHHSQRLLEPIHQKFVRISSGGIVQSQPTGDISQINSAVFGTNKRNQLLTVVPEDGDEYFKIKIFCAEIHKCALCILKYRCKLVTEICDNGCQIPFNDEQIKYTFNMFKKLEIIIDWNERQNGDSYYVDTPIILDQSYQKYKKQESEVICGIPLLDCLDLYSKKEKIEGYNCDFCKENTTALMKPLISHLPDILVLQLKRFNFESGYLDKIEDLVTYPIRNLDMSKFLINGVLRQNTNYDLYAVINHHMYQTGGHYTSLVQIKTEIGEPIWVLTNDALVSLITASEIVKKDAYMLFYKRRELTPSNILKLTHQV